MQYLQKKFFPTPHHKNLVIAMISPGDSKDYSCLITEYLPDLH